MEKKWKHVKQGLFVPEIFLMIGNMFLGRKINLGYIFFSFEEQHGTNF